MPRLIVIDPGHGGADPGAVGATGLEEAQVVLAVGRRVEQYLKRMGYRVLMTRTDDRGLALAERAAMANRAGADLFISVHANAAFLSNPAEAYLLAQEWFQEKAALGITAGVHGFQSIP
jgi:N-acetylmuramoyl-L-alanine amidase